MSREIDWNIYTARKFLTINPDEAVKIPLDWEKLEETENGSVIVTYRDGETGSGVETPSPSRFMYEGKLTNSLPLIDPKDPEYENCHFTYLTLSSGTTVCLKKESSWDEPDKVGMVHDSMLYRAAENPDLLKEVPSPTELEVPVDEKDWPDFDSFFIDVKENGDVFVLGRDSKTPDGNLNPDPFAFMYTSSQVDHLKKVSFSELAKEAKKRGFTYERVFTILPSGKKIGSVRSTWQETSTAMEANYEKSLVEFVD